MGLSHFVFLPVYRCSKHPLHHISLRLVAQALLAAPDPDELDLALYRSTTLRERMQVWLPGKAEPIELRHYVATDFSDFLQQRTQHEGDSHPLNRSKDPASSPPLDRSKYVSWSKHLRPGATGTGTATATGRASTMANGERSRRSSSVESVAELTTSDPAQSVLGLKYYIRADEKKLNAGMQKGVDAIRQEFKAFLDDICSGVSDSSAPWWMPAPGPSCTISASP